MTRNTYAEYLTQKLTDVNDKLASSVNQELIDLKNEEKLLQSALATKTRQELIGYIEQDLEMEKLDDSLKLARTATKLSKSSKNDQNLIGYIERDLGMEKLNNSLELAQWRREVSSNLEMEKLNHSLQLARTATKLSTSSKNNHNLINYLERDLEIEKLKLLNESLNLKASNLQTSRTVPLNTSTLANTQMSTATLNDLLLKESLNNENLRSHFLVHKPDDECNICSPNNIYVNTLKNSSDNLRSFLRNSIKANQIENEKPKVVPNVVYSTKDFKKTQPLSYSEYLKLFNRYENQINPPLTYDQKFRSVSTNSLNRSLSRSDLYSRSNDYNLEDDSVYQQNKYYNKYHEFTSSFNNKNNNEMRQDMARSVNALRRSLQPTIKSDHKKPWGYGKVETPYYESTNMRLSNKF